MIYDEVSGGAGVIMKGDPYFVGAPTKTGLGAGASFSIFHTLSNGALLEGQVGLVGRFVSASGPDSPYTLFAPYPTFRVQFTRMYVGVGFSPFVFSGTSLLSLSSSSGGLGFMGEGGILWPITPKFSLGFCAGAQFISFSGGMSPAPAIDAGVLMRFYLSASKDHGRHSNANENFHGWRYPMGNPLND
ncbi:hypothetical protein WDW86_15560 [Bdellovibrionota bacterium FG-2]